MKTFEQYIADSKNSLVTDRLHNSLTADEAVFYSQEYLHNLTQLVKSLPFDFFMKDIAQSEALREFLNIFLQKIQLEPSLTGNTTVNIVNFIELISNNHPENTELQALLTAYQNFYAKLIVTILSGLKFELTTKSIFIATSPYFETMLELKPIVSQHLLSLENNGENKLILNFCLYKDALLNEYCRRDIYVPLVESGLVKSFIEAFINAVLPKNELTNKIEERLTKWETQSFSHIIQSRESWTFSSNSRGKTPSPEFNKKK